MIMRKIYKKNLGLGKKDSSQGQIGLKRNN